MTEPGTMNSLTDIDGIRVGSITRSGDGWQSGTTVVLAPEAGMVAGVDVRGGGPGTRETDLLDPTASVERIHALTFSGGSAYGLAAASGVADALGDEEIGFKVGPAPEYVVPIVPSAVVFDLGRGGDFRCRPGHAEGVAATRAAMAGPEIELGAFGAGAGALTGGLKGGIGTASLRLSSGATVAALVVLNSHGSPIDLATGEPLAKRLMLPGDVSLATPSPDDAERWRQARLEATAPTSPVQNTTIGVIATDVTLTKAQCTKMAGIGHDGLARSIDPVHTLFDGDTLFGVSTATHPVPTLQEHYELLAAAAACVSRAVVRALVAAPSVSTPAGSWTGYLDAFPSARR